MRAFVYIRPSSYSHFFTAATPSLSRQKCRVAIDPTALQKQAEDESLALTLKTQPQGKYDEAMPMLA